ncbi:hypothetical protein JYT61_00890 [bacterium AH-315-E10]|nr:hypothetical protein [bacterium AH-315-E10]
MNCLKCKADLPVNTYNTGTLIPCPACRTRIQLHVFPAAIKKAEEGEGGESLTSDIDASCFYHQNSQADATCEACGKFLCKLCDVFINEKHFCPNCVNLNENSETNLKKKADTTHYDSVALSLALVATLIFYFGIVLIPASLYFSIRYFNKPQSIVPRTRIRFIIAILISCLHLIGWTIAFILIAWSLFS